MRPLLRVSVLLLLLAAGLAQAQDSAMCRTLCEGDKTRCRSDNRPASAGAVATTIGVVGAMLAQPKAFEGTQAVDAKRDMRDVLADKQRASADSKTAAREWEDKCNQSYLQCLGTCNTPPEPAKDDPPKN